MSPLFLYDDAVARTFEPFALTRPTGELRAGAELIRRRWERVLGLRAHGFIGAPHLAEFEELDAPAAATGALPAGAVLVNARCVPALVAADATADRWTCGGHTAAVRLRASLPVDALADGALSLDALDGLATGAGRVSEVPGWWLGEVWDLLGQLGATLADDLARLGPTLAPQAHPATVLGTGHPVFVEEGAHVEPHVVLDVSAGPILVRRGATVQAFTRLVGPCYVGVDSLVTADKIANCSIGEVARVHGEMSSSIVLGHANKAHDGFVGHSYLGRWVNLGAGTTTSNLKNTYGPVALWTPAGVRSTGLQFLGTLFGDHAKTGITLPLNTGTVVGAGAMVYERMPGKVVPPFAWGSRAPYDTYDVERFLQVAERAMARRSVPLTDRARATLRRAHARALATFPEHRATRAPGAPRRGDAE